MSQTKYGRSVWRLCFDRLNTRIYSLRRPRSKKKKSFSHQGHHGGEILKIIPMKTNPTKRSKRGEAIFCIFQMHDESLVSEVPVLHGERLVWTEPAKGAAIMGSCGDFLVGKRGADLTVKDKEDIKIDKKSSTYKFADDKELGEVKVPAVIAKYLTDTELLAATGTNNGYHLFQRKVYTGDVSSTAAAAVPPTSVSEARLLLEFLESINVNKLNLEDRQTHALLSAKCRVLHEYLRVISWLNEAHHHHGSSSNYDHLRTRYKKRTEAALKALKAATRSRDNSLLSSQSTPTLEVNLIDEAKILVEGQGFENNGLLIVPFYNNNINNNNNGNDQFPTRRGGVVTVGTIKRRIHEMTGIPSQRQHLSEEDEEDSMNLKQRIILEDRDSVNIVSGRTSGAGGGTTSLLQRNGERNGRGSKEDEKRRRKSIYLKVEALLVERLLPSLVSSSSIYPFNGADSVLALLKHAMEGCSSEDYKNDDDDDDDAKDEDQVIQLWVRKSLDQLYAVVLYFLLDLEQLGGKSDRKHGKNEKRAQLSSSDFVRSFVVSPSLENKVRCFHAVDSALDIPPKTYYSSHCRYRRLEEHGGMEVDEDNNESKKRAEDLNALLGMQGGKFLPEAFQCLVIIRYLNLDAIATSFVGSLIESIKTRALTTTSQTRNTSVSSLSSSYDVSVHEHELCVRILLEHWTSIDALVYIRTVLLDSLGNDGSATSRRLFFVFFDHFCEMDDVAGLVKLALTPEEENHLKMFLEERNEKDILLMYYLQRGNVAEALKIKNQKKFLREDDDDQFDAHNDGSFTSMLIKTYRKTFPKTLFDGSYDKYMSLGYREKKEETESNKGNHGAVQNESDNSEMEVVETESSSQKEQSYKGVEDYDEKELVDEY
mmetsp:Transcript_8530/g.13796  ORF Transcript_8530/g.13796 Transcript_8530/m.13796 type:complete len:879 (+) Transcript_8530:290-2926(+)